MQSLLFKVVVTSDYDNLVGLPAGLFFQRLKARHQQLERINPCDYHGDTEVTSRIPGRSA